MTTSTRREFLGQASAITMSGLVPYIFTSDAEARLAPRSPNDRLRLGAIGLRYQGSVITEKAQAFGDVVAICDVDGEIAEKARKQFGGQAAIYEDYRKLLDRQDLDVVLIGTPDHWHTAMTIAACRAGKDVYCEKPLTLTIDEGKLLTRVVKETGRVVQVGSWQRSDDRFRRAIEMVHAGRIGKLQKVSVAMGKNVQGGQFPVAPLLPHFNWDLWLGQCPAMPYIKERGHYTFRWWYESSGGEMTDTGAHHLDIAQWAIGAARSGPVEIDGQATFPKKMPDGYNVATNYQAIYRYANGVELHVADEGRNGILFEGDEGRIFVNRGLLAGKAVDDLATNPLPREKFSLYANDNLNRPPRAGKLDAIINHMGNFHDCLVSRKTPISDVETQHRSVSTCHLGTISMRLGRKLKWNPETELFVNDDEANTWLKREQRKGFEIV
ncbi:MAG: iolG 16 [Planctomycetaceae bacterium]|nr:iolG 16 [Planctomycetaceae bacterium]